MSPSKVNCPSEDNHEAHFAKHSWHFDMAHRRVTNGRYCCGHDDEGPTTHGGDRASCLYQPLGFSRYELPVDFLLPYYLPPPTPNHHLTSHPLTSHQH